MKKILLLLALQAAFLNAFSQTNKGDWMVGGSFYSYSMDKSSKGINISPDIAYFLIKNLAVGADLTLGFGKVDSSKSSAYGAGPLLRYYFGSGKFRPIAQAKYNYYHQVDKGSGEVYRQHSNNFSFGLGAALFLNRNVTLDGLFTYSEAHFGDSGFATSRTFAFVVGFQVYLIGKKKNAEAN